MTDGWRSVSLGELLRLERRPVEVLPDRSYQEIGTYSFGRGIFHKSPRTGLEVGEKSLFLLKEGDFILQVTFAWEGAVALVSSAEEGLYASTRYPTFRVNDNLCVPEFLLYYFKTEDGLQQLIKVSPGSAGRNRVLNLKRLPEIKVPLPSLPKQREVVAYITNLASQIHRAKFIRKQSEETARALVQSELHRFTLHLQPTGSLSDVLLGPPRNGWSAQCDNAEGGIAVLSLAAVTGFRYRDTEFKRTSLYANPSGHFWLKSGDILITRSNTPDLVGHVAVYTGYPSPCIYPDLMMRLDLVREKVEPRFVWYWLQSPLSREFIKRHSKGTSPTMKKISQGIVMAIPFPSSLSRDEQRRMVAELDVLQGDIDTLRRLQAEVAAEIDALLPAVMYQTFSGRL
jgi:type I restriction enzyme, S subunit